MTRRDKALIFLALGGLPKIEGKSMNLRAKKPANALTRRAFNLVAGARSSHTHRLLPLVITLPLSNGRKRRS
jgi:hypothetical protein